MEQQTSPIRVLLVDDHSLVRSAFRSLLEKMSGIEVVGEANDGHEALELVRSTSPHVMLLDIAMPGLGGLEALPPVLLEFPSVKVLILSALVGEQVIDGAFRAGAAGYLLKHAEAEELEIAIRAVAEGKVYLSPTISRAIINNYVARIGGESTPQVEITPRQRQVLQLIAEGKNTKEIAGLLEISIKTVESHRLQLMARLDIHDVPSLVRYAVRNGMVEA